MEEKLDEIFSANVANHQQLNYFTVMNDILNFKDPIFLFCPFNTEMDLNKVFDNYANLTKSNSNNRCKIDVSHSHCPFCGYILKAGSTGLWITRSLIHWYEHVQFPEKIGFFAFTSFF